MRYFPTMGKRQYGRHYIREWREKRGLSLRQLAGRLETEPGGEPLLSHASLGRIEKGEQPYTEGVLEAIEDALSVSRAELLEMNPLKDHEVIDLMHKLSDAKREQAIDYLKFLANKR